MNTLVRGQKLPVFSGPGCPGSSSRRQIVERARAPRGEPFAVVFVGIGITARETRGFLDRFRASGALERSVLYLNEARDPTHRAAAGAARRARAGGVPRLRARGCTCWW